MKSIGAEYTFETDTGNWSEVDNELLALIESVYKRLQDENMTFRTVTLKIRFKGFETYTRSKTLRFSSKNRDVVVKAIESLSNEFRNYPKKIRLVGVRLSGLEGVRSKDAAVGTLDSLTKSKG